jgi:hypothetical protein
VPLRHLADFQDGPARSQAELEDKALLRERSERITVASSTRETEEEISLFSVDFASHHEENLPSPEDMKPKSEPVKELAIST